MAMGGIATSPPLTLMQAGPFEVSAEWQGRERAPASST